MNLADRLDQAHGAGSGRPGAMLASTRLAACIAAVAALVTAPGAGAAGPLPNPCAAVPSADIAAAFGVTNAPPSTLSVVLNTATCTYLGKGVFLTLFVGYTSLGPPGQAKKTTKVPNLPHGVYSTYTTTSQTDVRFYKGTAATGVYGIVRTGVSKPHVTGVSKGHLQSIARTLYQSM